MKKLFSTLAVAALTALSLNAQIKEGTITYNMTLQGLSPEEAAMMGDMESVMSFKTGKSLTEASSIMGSSTFLFDETGMLMLQDQMGNKTGMKQTKEEMEKEAAKEKTADPKIEYTDETKTIAGYECKKAIVTVVTKDKKEEKMDVWYSDKFENTNKEGKGQGQDFRKGLKGMPFEYGMSLGTLKIKFVAKSVSTDPVPDSKFVLSTEGYKMMTMDEMKSMRGGK
ncbi:MAG: hypothetical protein V4677_15890 [Bacteroidota bacterium]